MERTDEFKNHKGCFIVHLLDVKGKYTIMNQQIGSVAGGSLLMYYACVW